MGLERAFAAVGLEAPRRVRRRASEYRTSFPLEELELTLEDGAELRLAFKQLGWSALGDEARVAKPRFLHDPRREPAVYAFILASAELGAPRYYGSVVAAEEDRHWLFVEWIEGRELYQVGERSVWEVVARWLAGMHAALGEQIGGDAAGRLIVHDAAYYRRWMERAREFGRSQGQPRSRSTALDWLAERHETVVEALLELPRTVIHGEFYASNVLVDIGLPLPRVAPVDWELAAAGPGLADLAALVSGSWERSDREAIVAAYGSVAGEISARDLDLARLQVAVQWLGWAPPEWVPPEGQRHDWLGEALALAEGLGL
jgi:aminoglycoside phosphotransferase (APT) family kinase protein